MSALLDQLLTPEQRKEVAAADAIAKCESAFASYRQAKPAFDADYGSYNGHPNDPRYVPDEEIEGMFEQITEAQSQLQAAFDALGGFGVNADVKRARECFKAAIDALSDAE